MKSLTLSVEIIVSVFLRLILSDFLLLLVTVSYFQTFFQSRSLVKCSEQYISYHVNESWLVCVDTMRYIKEKWRVVSIESSHHAYLLYNRDNFCRGCPSRRRRSSSSLEWVRFTFIRICIYVFFLFYFYSLIINDNMLFIRSFMQKCKNARKFYRLSALKIS